MKRAANVVLSLLLVVVWTGIGISRMAAPAYASSCYGYSCHGRDPVAAGCPVSSTTVTYGAYATVWNRYSYVCKANWARAQLTPAAISAGYQWSVGITTIDSLGYSERACEPTTDS